ncbi:glycosyltransferase [Pseudoalteromonas sp. SIMBA_153]
MSAAKEKGVDVTMFTVMSRQQIKKQINEYKEVSKLDGVKVIETPHTTLNMLYTAIYLFFNMLKYKKVALIAKKVELRPLRLTKFIFGKNFKYYIEVEGDGLSEYNYLQRNPYKNGFYDDYLFSAKASIDSFAEKIKGADGLLVLSKAFKEVLLKRHSFLKAEKVQVTSTGFVKGRLTFSAKNRQAFRNKLCIKNEHVFVYAGNVYYSWQNIKNTLCFFKYYLENVTSNAKFIILTHKSDQFIVKGFMSKLSLPDEKIVLKEVPNSEVVNYYNAADICVLLRDNDLMNEVASPGKIGEYAASGTPILTSSYIGDYAQLFQSQDLVAQVDDVRDFALMARKVQVLLEATDKEKTAFSNWSNDRLSSQNNVNSFIKAFEM